MKIVIAEDDAVPRLILSRALKLLNFEVTALSSGEDAWNHLRSNDAQVLITDWMMPGMDGLELCRKLRERNEPIPYLYVILLTARSSREDRLKALDAGADDFLSKPVDDAELFARLNVARRIMTMQEQLRRRSAELERMHSALEQRNLQLAEIASSDGLTGLKNHRYFRESLEAQFNIARRNGLPLSVMMLDVDSFKSYNDTFGHPSGDEVLRELSRILRGCVRDQDIVARYGGEEFAALLPSTDVESSLKIAHRLRRAIEEYSWPLRPITISLGIATMTTDLPHPSILIDQADRSLYHSKSQGRNRVTHAQDFLDQDTHSNRLKPAEFVHFRQTVDCQTLP
jgi:two-component system chemotaxis response regulator CheY